MLFLGIEDEHLLVLRHQAKQAFVARPFRLAGRFVPMDLAPHGGSVDGQYFWTYPHDIAVSIVQVLDATVPCTLHGMLEQLWDR